MFLKRPTGALPDVYARKNLCKEFLCFKEKGPSIVAQCSATPASAAATPPCSATPFQRQLDVRHPWQLKGDRRDRVFFGGGRV